MIRRLVLAMALTVALLAGGTAPADAAPTQPSPVPTAAQLCYYISWHNIGPSGAQVLFAQYEVLTPTYAQARCLVAWSCCGGYLFAGYNARVYSSGAWAGPYGLVWS